jgi:hypothetical protein
MISGYFGEDRDAEDLPVTRYDNQKKDGLPLIEPSFLVIIQARESVELIPFTEFSGSEFSEGGLPIQTQL